MTRFVTTMTLVGAGLLAATPLHGQSDRDAVLQVVDDLFDGMRSRDEALLTSVFNPGASLRTAGEDEQGRPRVSETPASDFVNGVVNSRRTVVLDERTYNPIVQIDGNLASVWVEYDLYLGDEFSHCGVDAFQMARTPEGWKIIALADTRQREDCPAR